MKKVIYKFALFLSLIAGISSCSLDEYNPSNATADDIFSTVPGYEKLVNSCYYNLQKSFFGVEDYAIATEAGTDLWAPAALGTYAQEFFLYNNMNTSATYVKKIWNAGYTPINLCNAAIERASKAGYTSDDVMNAKVAEAHFLRAFYYFVIVEQYGDVVLETKETTGPVLTGKRSTVESFYDVILSDLEFAAKWLPVTSSEVGRATRKSALGLLAKAYLQRSSYGDTETYAKKAKETADELINNRATYNTDLYSTFAEVFDDNNNKSNKEALFVVTSSDADPGNLNPNGWTPVKTYQFFLPTFKSAIGFGCIDKSNAYGRPAERFMPTKYLLNVFSNEDNRYQESFTTTFMAEAKVTLSATDLNNYGKDASLAGHVVNIGDTALVTSRKPVANKASRPYLVVDINDLYNADGTVVTNNLYNKLYPNMSKFFVKKYSTGNSNQYSDIFVMRLAEVYLIAAEADVLLGKTDEAADMVNVLHKRACKAEDFVTGKMKASASEMTIDYILDERARELCGEHMRWYDLKRTKKLKERIEKYNKNIKAFDESIHYLRPISQDYLDVITNAAEFGKNPGY